ncbi:Carboxypeptidase S [Wickerhamomyces ciferrii]|uniref:Carboxypeptidase S n=1 Tax=Wickerhamomyces ciferrii (strain ATCC 14091 / BCRC 22168 / CBS 111 / JCM 3599 / NBRC 0793 / NRRL Y-1031 F-60-10) TaxID=1206466 RepID=K0KS81_WICCF|nr:Carboxypeptidase S [Wickerhamomyces ciferrii]CCH46021.1 Carboxypeptidase S [Wickerhamomyces ciferrii]
MSIQLGEQNKPPVSLKKRLGAAIISIIVLALISTQVYTQLLNPESIEELSRGVCEQGKVLRPSSYLKDKTHLEYIVKDKAFREESIKKVIGAVRIPTVTYDYYEDPLVNPQQWNNFTRFHAFLEAQFPTVYQNLKVSRLNGFGLVFEWEGSNSKLKPILLAAHQDVVPVEQETISKWKYPPFEGVSDGKYIWGRGSSDTKTLLISTLQSVERLIHDGFNPRRTIVLGYGFDEEIGGKWGAFKINEYLINKYGKDSFFSLIDEGGNGVSFIDDVAFGVPAIAEKGPMNVNIALTTPGGHSSVPPDHTNIGILSQLVNEIESTPFDPSLSGNNPFLNFIQCVAKYTDEYDKDLKKNILKAAYDKVANSKVIKFLHGIKKFRYSIQTSQAIDIVHGGVKANALPEYSTLVINHRISVDSSIDEAINKIIGNVVKVAKKFDLGVYQNEVEVLPKTENGYFELKYLGLAPSPVSPLDTKSWEVLSGSIRHILDDYVFPNASAPSVVAGGLDNANTDTSKYWDLTKNIYRFKFNTLSNIEDVGTHSVNEHILIDDHIHLIAFNYEFILNADEADDE